MSKKCHLDISLLIIKTGITVVFVILIILFFLFVVPPFINCVVTPPSWFDCLGFIDNPNRGDWIGFYGAIIGGGATLGAVWWSIIEQRKQLTEQKENFDKQRQDDLAILYKPILLISDSEVDEAERNTKDRIFTYHFKIKNLGRGEANIDDITISSTSEQFTICHNLKKIEIIVANQFGTTLDIVATCINQYANPIPQFGGTVIIKYHSPFAKDTQIILTCTLTTNPKNNCDITISNIWTEEKISSK